MTVQDFIKGQLAWLAWMEAHHLGGVQNMIAVAFVVKNRVRAGWHGGDWAAVMNAHYQYSANPQVALIELHSLPDCRDRDFIALLQNIDGILSGSLQDTYTAGGLYYCELNNVTRDWFKENVLAHPEQHPRVATVATVTFFS